MISASAEGITIINFGMGSPNAAIIMDLLSAIQPKACLFLGKCGGIDKKNRIGDLILPIAAIRGEGTSNDYFPPEVPSLPAFMLQRAVSSAIRDYARDYWTGTVYTTNRRIWEHDENFKEYLKKTRAMAVDMETATLFSCGFANHIPTGALLLVSDQPMIPEGVKTDKSDNIVTQNYVTEHVEIGIASLRMIIDEKKTVKHLVKQKNMAKQEITCDDIIKELKAGQYRPVYYLMGEEPYYIDLLSDYITDNILNETEKEFNLTVMYGADVDVATIINAAKRYPMMSEHQVVVVKEAQNIRNMEELSYYLQKPLLSTILVICHKHGTLDRRKKLAAEIEKSGILFESKKVRDAQLPTFITSYMKRKGVDMDPKATSMLADFVGTDLSRLTGELEKLIITLPKSQTRVTPEQIERNIGISKDYNNFELRSAIVEKDILKANKIIKYFEENPKTNPIQMTLSLLFGFFSNLMLAYYAPEKTEQGIASFIGLKTPWQSREYLNAMRRYNGVKTMQIIGEIRYTDAKSKGVGNSSLNDSDLLRELIFKILH